VPGGPSLWQPFERERGNPNLLRVWTQRDYVSWSWEDWHGKARGVAAGLRSHGVGPGDRVACLLSNSPGSCATVLGTWLAGGCVVSLPLPARGMSPDAYLRQLRLIINDAEPTVMCADGDLVGLLTDAELTVRLVAYEQLERAGANVEALQPMDRPAVIQYSSGSTGAPKGCVLSAGSIAWQLEALQRALEIDADTDVGVVWLPLSHDMGLFGCLLLTYWTGHPLVLGTPQRFLTQPHTWLQDCAHFGATITASPPFGLAFATRVAARLPAVKTPMRRVIIGGERIEPGVLDAAGALAPWGFSRSTLVPAYGLAEAVLAVTMAPLARGPRVIEVDADDLAQGRVTLADPNPDPGRGSATTAITSVGTPLAGVTVSTGDDGTVGQIRVESPGLADGYFNDPTRTAERFGPSGVNTRDLGFVLDDELFVAGRADDLMTIAGRNVYAHEIENAIAALDGVRAGNCAVVDVAGSDTRRVVAILEPRDHHPELSSLAGRVGATALRASGVRIEECVFLARGQLPKTPSGKIQRYRCREIAGDPMPGTGTRIRVPVASD
jgi:fatty-acyl-CoA synthase